MQVRMLTPMAWNGQSYVAGDLVEVPDSMARTLVTRKSAERVIAPVETRVAAPPENRVEPMPENRSEPDEEETPAPKESESADESAGEASKPDWQALKPAD